MKRLLFQFSLPPKQAVMRGPTHVQRKESEKHPFRGTPKKPEKCQFLTDPAQNVQFSSFPEKNKNVTFYTP